jgi:hypothetical protein
MKNPHGTFAGAYVRDQHLHRNSIIVVAIDAVMKDGDEVVREEKEVLEVASLSNNSESSIRYKKLKVE